MNTLELAFNFEQVSVRTITDGEEIWFVGKDVAEALGYKNTRDALAKHVRENDKGVAFCDSLGGKQEVVVINEAGVYSLILRSNLPAAEKFQDWVTHDVLPSIRKQGFYSLLPDEELLDLLHERMKKNPRLIRDSTFDEKNKKALAKYDVVKSLSELRQRRKELPKKDYMNELAALGLTKTQYNAEYYDAERYYAAQELHATRAKLGLF